MATIYTHTAPNCHHRPAHMLLSTRAPVARPPLPAASHKLRTTIIRAANQESFQGVPVPQLDKELEQMLLSSPYDFFAFGPRVALAAALSIPETTQVIQQRVTRLQELVGDPRPLETKAAEVNTDVQVTLADYARRGRIVEEDILRNVAAVLPEELRALVPQPPVPPPTTTVVVEEEEEVFDYATFSATEVMEQQALAELADVKQAVASLQVALTSLADNKESGRDAMLRLSVREARDTLRGRLQRLSPTVAEGQGTTAAAVQEATALLEDVDAALANRAQL